MKLTLPDSQAFLMMSESEHNADMYYASGFLAYDSFIYLNSGNDLILVSDMELGRAKKESKVKEVVPTSRYNIMDKIRKNKDVDAAYCEMIRELLHSRNLNRIAVPYNFPVQLADCLRRANFEIIPVKSPLREMRDIKNEKEINAIEYAQRAGEKALSEGINAIKNASVRNGVLMYEDSPLKTEDVRAIIDRSLLSYNCEAPDIIIACGQGSSDPHWKGEGELLADEPIVIDMVPRSRKERYYSDMTRTVMHGTPSEELKSMYSAVLDSQEAALNKIKAGVTGAEIHNIVCDVLEERGYETSRGKSGEFTEGFIHSTGHGVGLDVHEGPTLSENGKELKAGCVVTVEPGLYYKKIGGVRLEDVVVVTHSGCKNLTMFEKNLVL
ncbi:MAG: Xaa-Pro aminopeptidase [Candidatus Methanoperedens nitroreducens]|uniref:Xaa-Pro aminopeptidase n=1 Tax=Candidatus Methanoperedens nitratireducens TaxID=1392998 RepID=A0A0P7ZFN1_9EURY|nr:Xaa-Pro peptidase family protein [Candidatus Methanoperedens sp. BLZ2]KAB2947509.1 MAG: aminopeptidase P family protein [Candidatus Methanoperedens sp.]KPQ42383.1 MAG: Xaa-Pro aminopeptidase [Candidatus Methanoperedens sp. BLZ1]MBZ0175112.1 Xaa-Pro peptidase family protein [Candidatus Methanoperedens nitroreducens]MCX9078677.1 Xaa-Pro peptidase family protein [Candidatus Methanoperedens sp.]